MSVILTHLKCKMSVFMCDKTYAVGFSTPVFAVYGQSDVECNTDFRARHRQISRHNFSTKTSK